MVLTVPGLMNGESSTAPTRPPPGPVMPGSGEPGPGSSPQQASVSEFAASSKVISIRPFSRYACEAMIFGTHVSRKASMSASAEAPLGWLVHGKSCPSLQRLGVMKENFGVLDSFVRSVASPVSPRSAAAGIAPVGEPSATTCLSQNFCSSITEWKYTNGLCRVA